MLLNFFYNFFNFLNIDKSHNCLYYDNDFLFYILYDINNIFTNNVIEVASGNLPSEEDIECPICLEITKHKSYVLPLCKHGMCGNCFVKFVDNGSVIKAPLCPMCREVIHNVNVFDVSMYNTIANK